MQKKILVGVLGTIWIIAFIMVGVCLSEYDLYQLSIGDIPEMQQFIEDMIYYILVLTFILSCIVFIIINYVFRQMNVTITKLMNEAASVQNGGDGHVIRHGVFEEFEEFLTTFDKMKEHYYRNTRKLQYQKSKAESIVNNLQQGIIILDEQGLIEEKNSYAVKYIEGLKDLPSSTSINYILRDPHVVKMLENAYTHKKYGSCEIEKDGNILHLRIHPITRRQRYYGYMVSIIDITRTRQLEEIRYQFVSNVTHELKTPLTSIQGFVETLKDGALEQPEIARRFLDIIDVEAKRLYRLIQDTLLLSEIEQLKNPMSEPIKLIEVVSEVEELLIKDATEKDVVLDIDLSSELYGEINREHFKQIIMNFMSNAVRYTDRGHVKLQILKYEEEICVRVEDTGIGIPKESIDRIFERFYTVDKSRSRKSGGTGLGLSIAKHIVQLYDGRVEVKSAVGKGTSFNIFLRI